MLELVDTSTAFENISSLRYEAAGAFPSPSAQETREREWRQVHASRWWNWFREELKFLSDQTAKLQTTSIREVWYQWRPQSKEVDGELEDRELRAVLEGRTRLKFRRCWHSKRGRGCHRVLQLGLASDKFLWIENIRCLSILFNGLSDNSPEPGLLTIELYSLYIPASWRGPVDTKHDALVIFW